MKALSQAGVLRSLAFTRAGGIRTTKDRQKDDFFEIRPACKNKCRSNRVCATGFSRPDATDFGISAAIVKRDERPGSGGTVCVYGIL